MKKSFIRRLGKTSFVTANIVVGLLFILGTQTKNFDPDTYWFLGILTLGLPILLVVLVLFLLFWLLVRPFWCTLSILFIAISWNAVRQIIPLRLSSDFTLEKEEESIRIMSWNVEQFNIGQYKTNPEGLSKMIDLINQYDPDIACFQEAVLGDKPESPNYLHRIVNSLNFKDYFFATRTAYTPNHRFGLIIFSKYPIINKKYVIKGKKEYNSDYEYVDLLIRSDTVRVFNVHLESFRFSLGDRGFLDSIPVSTPTSERSKKIISKMRYNFREKGVQADWIKKSMDSARYPLMLCGDFNDVPVSYAYETIGKGMKNAFAEKGAGFSRTFVHIFPTLRIDNIFVDPLFKVRQYKRVKEELSDHYPIIADVIMDTKP